MPSEVRGKALLKWKSIDLSSKLSLTYGRNVNYYKSVHHPISILHHPISILPISISILTNQ